MTEQPESKFINDINENMGIVFKISSLYASRPQEREDLKQEMLFHLWKSYGNFRNQSKFSTWMYKVCLNTALTYIKKEKRNHHLSLSAQEEQVSCAQYFPDEKLALLHGAIHKLSSVNKAIILLYLEELSYEEIANITGLSKSNVSVKLVRIKKELEKELKKYK